MSSEQVNIRNLDEGMFYLFLFFSMYVIKVSFNQFMTETMYNKTVINMVDVSTQTSEAEEKDFYELYEENLEILEHEPSLKKKKYLWFF